MFEAYPEQTNIQSLLLPPALDMSEITAETYKYNAMCGDNDVTTSAVWSIVSGSEYATMDATNGKITISSTASESPVTIQAVYNSQTATKEITLTYQSGSSAETTTEVVTDESGNTTTVVTTVTENEDGSSTEIVESVVTDSEGNVIGSTEKSKETNSDGSYTSNETNYDANGNATDGTNTTGDTDGNVSTQDVKYDESGNTIVTGYDIDTSGNPDGVKEFRADGVNTEYYALDVTQGFVMDIHFTIDFTIQPPGQSDGHHNIINSKRAAPEPWYGFQVRHSSTNKYIQLGTQFSTGSNANTTISTTNANKYNGSSNIYEYNLHIVYDPTAETNKFTCDELIGNAFHYTSNNTFPDIDDLKYIKTTVGCALDANGDPFRFSNIDVFSFSIKKLTNVSEPTIDCDGQYVTITCETVGADIYYRFNEVGVYAKYTYPLAITADTLVQAYAELEGDKSNTVSKNCLYDNGIATPVITCDGEYVSIACATTDAELYYRMNETGTYSAYTDSFEITATTVVEAYAQVGAEVGHTAKETCIYSPVVLVAPVIICDGEEVFISCETTAATINYRLNQEGNYSAYTTSFNILEDTVVEAYSTYRGRVSAVVLENCEYSPVHHYEKDYLTLRARTNGKIYWHSNGSGQAKTIDYSINGGNWSSMTATDTATYIDVVANDVVRFRGSNTSYAKDKSNYSGFGQGEHGTSGQETYDADAADVDVEGNIMSLIYGDNFIGQTTFSGGTYNFCSMFKKLKVVSAENLILPSLTLNEYCYRAMFSWCTKLTKAPQLPATTLAKGVYWYMFEKCAITEAPELLAEHLVAECYGDMFTGCTSLNYIKCMAIDGFGTSKCKENWVSGVASSGTFVKDSGVSVDTWSRGANGIPINWLVYDDVPVVPPTITYDGFSEITLSCETVGADIYYRLNNSGEYSAYTTAITITADTIIQTYSELNGQESRTVSQTCQYVSDVPIEYSNRDLKKWNYGNQEITTPYSVNAIDGHSASYAKGTFNFETSIALSGAQPTYLWFQHADHSASIYVDNTLVEKHWGGYAAFTTDISEYVHSGTNNIKVAIKNNEGNYVAPAAGDFNFNATLGNVRLLTSPYLPAMNYGYDGFHITSTVSNAEATVNIKTSVPTGATLVCKIDDGNTNIYSATSASTGEEMTFTKVIANPHLWNGKSDPYLYTVTLEIYGGNDLYHRFVRPYGLRYYEYVINDITKVGTSENPYTGFLLNGSPYLLRGCCMHDDIEGRANALTETDYNNTFATIQELGLNFLRLAHYPHPKEVYDRCDALGIVVQTEGPCVNKLQSTMPEDYYTHLTGQYTDMVNQHYNHPCIFFWGLSNETTTDDKAFGKQKVEEYTALIKSLDSERMVGYVLAQSPGTSPSAYYNDPSNVDWFGCNIYVGWYDSPNSNTPVSQINTRLNNTINRVGKPMAYSEYGCGGTQRCHSDDFMTTTTRGNHERHDIEYMMWLHEGHIATIKQYPQLMFTSQWQLFDIAVANRNEGYTVCLDGENTSIDDELRRLNNKGLVERDHVTKKDPFYLYKAWWNPTPFVHICGKNYTKKTSRVIKCYTNQTTQFTLKVNGTTIETKAATDNILTFTAYTFSSGDVVTVESGNISDTFTFE